MTPAPPLLWAMVTAYVVPLGVLAFLFLALVLFALWNGVRP